MKGFFNHVLASMLGTFLIVVLLVIINLIVMVGFISSVGAFAEDKIEVKDNTVLHLDFSTAVADRSSAKVNMSSFMVDKTLSLRSITETIKKAKEDDRIKGVFLDLSFLQVGIASVEEIRNALIDFKSSGKFILAHAEYYTHKTYYLATVADKVYITPEGMMQFTGLSGSLFFIKSMLQKIGVEPQVVRHGKFKSAVEPLLQDEASEANLEQTSKFINSFWNTMLNGIEKERNISKEILNRYADSLLITTSNTAKKYNLVDDLKYKDEILVELKSLSETEEDNRLELLNIIDYISSDKNFNSLLRPEEENIAIIYAEGSILSGKGSEGQIGSVTISEAIRKARKNKSVKAIVFRINSGGGSSLASEVIWRETVLAAKEKPFIVSFGDVAASGGYYIACAADTIVSQPNTITGSIGVFSLGYNAKELMNDIGININSVNTNKYSDLGSPARKMSDYEVSVMQNMVEEIYASFVSHVSEGRNLSKEFVDSVGQGRVWSGQDAKNLGMVDVLGGLQTAIDIASDKAGLEKYGIKTYPERDKLTMLLENMIGDVKSSFIEEELGESYIHYKRLKDLKEMKGIQARLPYYIDIK